jgi:hypothetical protein
VSPTQHTPSNQRFLLFAITYLLSTPSDFAKRLIEGEGDLDEWLRVDAGITDDSTRKLCINFTNKVKNSPLPYSFMQALRTSVRILGADFQGMYDSPPCPNGIDAAKILQAMAQIKSE